MPTLPLPDGTVLHRSSRTTMAVNATAPGRSTTAVVTSQLSMSVERGALRIECTGRCLQVEGGGAEVAARRRLRLVRGAR
ncbi:MAG: hypothetical protein WA159_17290 [Variovorax sp.]